jgi:hypothetical protein
MKITKAAIQELATQSVKDQYAIEADKAIYLESVIDAGGFDISLTDRPAQWDRCIDWLSDMMGGNPLDSFPDAPLKFKMSYGPDGDVRLARQ